jgi:hypothetical protein
LPRDVTAEETGGPGDQSRSGSTHWAATLSADTGKRLFSRPATCSVQAFRNDAERRRDVCIARLKPAAQAELAGLNFERAVFAGF